MKRRHVLTINLLELVALWGLAVVQPLLGVFGASVETFIANGIMPNTILPIVVTFCVVPPLMLWGVELAAARVSRSFKGVHYIFVTALLLAFFAQLFKVSLEMSGLVLVLLIILATSLGLLAIARVAFVGQWFRYLSVTPLLAVILFAVNTPSGRYALNSTGGSVENAGTDGSSIVFVMFDEFPLETLINADGQIDKLRFPNFYRLSQISTWYRNYTTNAEATKFAVPSVLSGRLPDFYTGPTVADHPENLFTWLGNNYKLNVSEVVTRLCPARVCKQPATTSTPGFFARLRSLGGDVYDVLRQRINPRATISVSNTMSGAAMDHVDQAASSASIPNGLSLTAEERLQRTRAQTQRWDGWVNNITSDGCPCLNFIHMLLPHQPWVFFPDGTTYFTTRPQSLVDETTWENRVLRQRSALQTQYADRLIGKLLDTLEARQLLGTTQVVVTADHGMSFDDGHDRRYVTGDYTNFPSIMYPPLFVHTPGQTRSTISDDNLESVDVMSVVADGVSATWPWKTDGTLPSLRTGDKRTKKTLYLQPGSMVLAIRPDKTLVVDSSEAQRKLFERAHSRESTADYLAPLYGGTKFDSLRSSTITSGSARCSCTVTLDDDVRGQNPTVYVSAVVTGNARAGDWMAFAVDGKISGLSPVYERGGKLRVMSLLKSEDYTSPRSVLTAYLIAQADSTPQRADIK